ncbi:uncharacterized protein TOT_040000799 [Theileria orientalis strain Shintoku]|uniref:Uncharacterized protein n=1 Tax=Theileria orientalis strain Shintoku TaxID=869250 RepID=J7MCC9_THEOR|nr:uncharacterized protein TOT_040000799 [Theileria orientalis strain Shintoku]BAM42432.1 uncharacterized protein TOT_040000799 [Theileria orientalis strain Shintoku]|eukprot:XP_009692733.1 uncharacterized protein TOT_040000799 [Theileria orientalis strain Shintoku]
MKVIYYLLTLLALIHIDLAVCPFTRPYFDPSNPGGVASKPEPPKPPDPSQTNVKSRSAIFELDSDNESQKGAEVSPKRISTAQTTPDPESGVEVEPSPRRSPAPVAVAAPQPGPDLQSGSVPRKSVQPVAALPKLSPVAAPQARPAGQPASKSFELESEGESDLEVVTPSSRAPSSQPVQAQTQPSVPRGPQPRAVPVEAQTTAHTNTPDSTTQPIPRAPPSPNQPQFITIELNNKKSNKYYTYAWDQYKYAHLFIPKTPYIINKVTDNTVVPWQYQGGKYPNEVRIAFDKDDNPSLELSFPADDVNFDTKFITIELRNKRSDDTYAYLWDQNKYAHVFIPRSPFIVNNITDSGNVAWTYNGGKYPKEIRIAFDQQNNPSLELDFDSDSEAEPQPSPVAAPQARPAGQPASKSFELESEGESDLEVVTPSSRAPSSQPVQAQSQPSAVQQNSESGSRLPAPQPLKQKIPQKGQTQLVSVDITHYASTNEVDYSYFQVEDIHRFLCKEGFLIYELKKGDRVKWRYQQGEYPNRVLLLKDENNAPVIRVLAPNDYDPSEPTGLPSPKFISVDITHYASTNEIDYSYFQVEDIHRFLCKEGFLIYELKKGDRVKWRYQQGEYPNRVLLLKDENAPVIRVLAPNDYDPSEPTGLPSPKFISVDITHYASTNEIDYSYFQVEDIHRFLCKEGFLIYELKKGDRVKWRYQQGEYPNRVLLLKDENNAPVIRVLAPNDYDPSEPTGLPSPKFISVDITHYASTNEIDYSYFQVEDIHRFLCKEGFLIYELKKGDRVKWRYQQGEYPNRVLLLKDENAPVIRVLAPNDYDPSEPTGLPSPKFISVDITHYASTNEIDYSYFQVEDIHRFLCKEGFLIYELKKGDRVKWRYQQGEYPNRVLLLKDENAPVIRVLAPNDYEPNEPVYQIPTPAPVEPEPEYETGLITANVDIYQSTDTIEYTYDPAIDAHTFKSRGSLLFNKVVRNGKVIWLPKNNRYGNRVVIKMSPDGSYKAKMHYPDDVPTPEMAAPTVPEEPVGVPSPVPARAPIDLESDVEVEPKPRIEPIMPQPGVEPVGIQPIGVLPTLVKPSDVSVSLDTEEGIPVAPREEPIIPKEQDVAEKVFETSEKFVYEPDPNVTPDFSSKAPINLNIKSTSSTVSYNYNKDKCKKTKIYSALSGYGFATVKYGGTCCSSEKSIWVAKGDKQYGKKVEIIDYWYLDMKELNIYLYDATKRKFFKNYEDPWTEIDMSKLNPKTMNITMTQESYFHTNSREDRYQIYVAKHPFVFNKVIQWRYPGIWKEYPVWSTYDSEEYASEIFRDGVGCSSIKNVTMRLLNGDYRHVKMVNGVWVKKSSYLDLDLNLKKSTFEFTYSKNKNSHTYETNFDFLFTKILIRKGSSCCKKETIIWEKMDNNQLANKVVFTKYIYDHMYDLIIYFHDGSKKMFIKNQKKYWTEVNLAKKYSIYLNIEALKDTYFYTYKRDRGYGTFEAKNPFVFSSLVEFKRIGNGTKMVWQARNPNEYAVKVVIDGSRRCTYTKNATLHLVTGKSLRLTRTGSLGCTPSFCCFFTLGLFNCCAKTWEQEHTIAITKPVASTQDKDEGAQQKTSFDIDDDVIGIPATTSPVPDPTNVTHVQKTSNVLDDDDVGGVTVGMPVLPGVMNYASEQQNSFVLDEDDVGGVTVGMPVFPGVTNKSNEQQNSFVLEDDVESIAATTPGTNDFTNEVYNQPNAFDFDDDGVGELIQI